MKDSEKRLLFAFLGLLVLAGGVVMFKFYQDKRQELQNDRISLEEKVAEIILTLNQKNDYGIRDALFECAGECLPESVIRSMISTLQQNDGSEGYGNCSSLIESLARQIKDAPLFAETREKSGRLLNSFALVEMDGLL